MKLRYFLATILFPVICFAESPYSVNFEDYSVKDIYKGKPAKVNLSSHPDARTYRTVLRTFAKEGPNFAGRYTIVTWGAGTACDAFAIIDAKNGNVYFPENLIALAWFGMDNVDKHFDYRRNSKLLIVLGSPNEQLPKGVYYYVWEKNRLKLIKSETKE